MKLNPSFSALSAVVIVALCIGQAHADTVTTPLGLTQVDDNRMPITPLTYLNLEPASKELADAAKKVTTPPPLPHQKRLLPSPDHLTPVVESFTSQGISIKRELGNSLIPSLPILGALDNEGDHTNQKRLLDALEALEPSEDTQYLPENHQQLGTVHPLNRRGEDPVDLNVFGQKLPKLELVKLPASKRGKSSGLNILGNDVPLEAIPLDSLPLEKLGTGGISRRDENPIDLGLKTGNQQDFDSAKSLLGGLLPIKRDDSPLDLGLKTGNQQDLDSAKSLLGGLLPIKRDEVPVKPLDLGLQTGNEQDMQRATDFLGSLLGGGAKRDSISPDGIDLGSLQSLGEKAFAEGKKNALPLALAPVKQAASPAVQGVKTVDQVCTAFGCTQMVQGAVQGLAKDSPIPIPLPLPLPLPVGRALGEKDLFANGILNNGGEVQGIPVRRDQNPAVQAILDTSDEARDAVLDLKTTADNAAGEFVKNMYSKNADVKTKRAFNLPSYSLLPGWGPPAKEAVKEVVDFVGLPGTRRMEKVRRRE